MALMYPINFPNLELLEELWRNGESDKNDDFESNGSKSATLDFFDDQMRVVEMAEAIADQEREMAANTKDDVTGAAGGSTSSVAPVGGLPSRPGGTKTPSSAGSANTSTNQAATGTSASQPMASSSISSGFRYGRRQIQRVGASMVAADRASGAPAANSTRGDGDRSVGDLIDSISAAVFRPSSPTSIFRNFRAAASSATSSTDVGETAVETPGDDGDGGAPLASVEDEEDETLSFHLDSPDDSLDGQYNSNPEEASIEEDDQEEVQEEISMNEE